MLELFIVFFKIGLFTFVATLVGLLREEQMKKILIMICRLRNMAV